MSGGILNNQFTANLPWIFQWKKFVNRLRFEIIVAKMLWPHFFGPPGTCMQCVRCCISLLSEILEATRAVVTSSLTVLSNRRAFRWLLLLRATRMRLSIIAVGADTCRRRRVAVVRPRSAWRRQVPARTTLQLPLKSTTTFALVLQASLQCFYTNHTKLHIQWRI